MTRFETLFNRASRWYFPTRWLIILFLGLAIYSQTFGFEFVFDDEEFIVLNPYIRSFDSVEWIWDQLPRTRAVGIYSFALNFFINKLDPRGYHIFNFLVHLVATGLVWLLASLIFRVVFGAEPSRFPVKTAEDNRKKKQGKKGQPVAIPAVMVSRDRSTVPFDWLRQEMPFLVALVYLVHPCQTQAVTYITQRFESMATVFYLAAVFFYLRARIAALAIFRILFFTSAGLATALGMLTKEIAATIPVMVLVSEAILFQGRGPGASAKAAKPAPNKARLWPFVLLVVTAVAFLQLFLGILQSSPLALLNQRIPSESHDGDIFTTQTYVLTQMRVFLTFCRLLLFPVNQNLEYDYPMSAGLLTPPLTLVGMLVIGAMIVAVVRLRRAFPIIAYGLAWMLVTFSINLAPRANAIFEHKLYLISFGFFLAVGGLLVLVPGRRRWIVPLVIVCAVAILAAASFQRNKVWRNSLALWEDIALKSSRKARVIANLGSEYTRRKQNAKGIEFLSRAVEMNPNDFKSYQNRGNVYLEQGKNDLALADYNKALSISPGHAIIYINRAQAYLALGDGRSALEDMDRAIRLQPGIELGYREKGIILLKMGRFREALRDLQQALNVSSRDRDAFLFRGIVYYCLGEKEQAFSDWGQVEALDPGNAVARKLVMEGRSGQSPVECRRP
jgi:tetratricopeptide (TPR) repeat protein